MTENTNSDKPSNVTQAKDAVSSVVANNAPKKGSNKALWLTFLLIVIAAGGYLLSVSGLDKAVVEQQLEHAAAQIKTYGEKTGQDVSFTYENVEMQGGFFSRKAIVNAPVITAKNNMNLHEISLSANKAILSPSGEDFARFTIEVPDQVKVTSSQELFMLEDRAGDDNSALESEKSVTEFVIAFDEAMRADVGRKTLAGINVWEFDSPMPSKMIVSSSEEEGEVVITSGAGSNTSSIYSDDGEIISQNISMKNISVSQSGGEKGSVTVDNAVINFVENLELRDSKNRHYDYMINVDNAKATGIKDDVEETLGPLKVALDASYTGPVLDDSGMASLMQGVPYKALVRDFSVQTPQSTFAMNADFAGGEGDFLPIGNAKVNLTNFPYLRDEFIESANDDRDVKEADEMRALAHYLLTRTVGTGYYDTQDIDLTVSREKGGTFTIGQLTFEEIIGVMLGGAGNLPVPEKPASNAAAPVANTPVGTNSSDTAQTTDSATQELDKAVKSIEETIEKTVAPVTNVPAVKAPKVKVPEVKAPEVKVPTVKEPSASVKVPDAVPSKKVEGMPFNVQVKSPDAAQ